MLSYSTVEQNLRDAMGCYAYASGDGEIRLFPGVKITSSGVNYSVFNSVMLTSPVEGGPMELAQRITLGEVHFTTRRLARSYWICEDMLSMSARIAENELFSNHGMRCIASPPGMLAERVLPPVRPLAHMDLRLVDDPKTRFHFTELASTIFALPFPIAERIYGPEATWKSDMDGYVGYVAGRHVSIVTTVVGSEAVGIYSLGTDPEHQGYGYGEAI